MISAAVWAIIKRIWPFVTIVVLCLTLLATCSLLQKASRDRDLADGRTVSGKEAIDKIEDLRDRGDVTDKQVKESIDEVRKADPAERDAVARRELCKLQYRC